MGDPIRSIRENLATRYLALATALALQGCITEAMWHKEQGPPELDAVSVHCEVLGVTTSGGADDPSIHVRFAPQDAPAAPPQLSRFDPDRPGLFELQPHAPGDDWRQIAGAELFNPSSWDLRITSGTYFTGVPANALLEFHGVVRPGDLGELVPAEQLPPGLRELGELPGDYPALWQTRCLESFRAHAWIELLSPMQTDGGYRQVPLAWVDDHLNTVATIRLPESASESENDAVRARLRGLRLLARLDDGAGNQHYALIGVPVLLQGTELDLRREGAAVHWTRSQIWTARLLARASEADGGTEFAVPLRGRSFDYRWFGELEEGGMALDLLRVLATPITAALDFVIMTNGPLSNLARYLAGDENALKPKSTGK